MRFPVIQDHQRATDNGDKKETKAQGHISAPKISDVSSDSTHGLRHSR
jgi:hypothetical protein